MSKRNSLVELPMKLDKNALNPLVDKLTMRGLNYRQRRFIFCYNGNAIAAAEAAGYCSNYKKRAHKKAALAKVVYRLMRNETIQRNIYLIQKQLEEFGVLSVAEAKDIISQLARKSDNERVRMEAAKLALQWEGALADPVKRYELDVKMQQHNINAYEFKGPKSNFLKFRELAEQAVIDVTPRQTDQTDIDIDYLQ